MPVESVAGRLALPSVGCSVVVGHHVKFPWTSSIPESPDTSVATPRLLSGGFQCEVTQPAGGGGIAQKFCVVCSHEQKALGVLGGTEEGPGPMWGSRKASWRR